MCFFYGLWHQHASRCTGRCAEGCRVSTGLVGVVVLMLSYIIPNPPCLLPCAFLRLRLSPLSRSVLPFPATSSVPMSDACDPQPCDASVCCSPQSAEPLGGAPGPTPLPVHTHAPHPTADVSQTPVPSLPTPYVYVHTMPTYDPQLHPHHHSYQQA